MSELSAKPAPAKAWSVGEHQGLGRELKRMSPHPFAKMLEKALAEDAAGSGFGGMMRIGMAAECGAVMFRRLSTARVFARCAASLAFILVAAGGAALAGDTVPVSDSAVIPDLRATERDASGFDDYYFFHKPGVRLERAKADLTQCYSYYANTNLFLPAPVHVPYGDEPSPANGDQYWIFRGHFGGLVGMVLIDIEGDSDKRHWGNINLRRCMMYKGYKRYGTSKSAGKQLAAGSMEDVINRYAAIASGPAPAGEAIEP